MNESPCLAQSPYPSVGSINFNLGIAHKEMGREGGIEQATLYFQKAIKLSKKAGDNVMLSEGWFCLYECYVMMGRAEEAMDIYKSLCDEIGKESIDPDSILTFAGILFCDNSKVSHALEILEEHLDTIGSSWENQNQCRAYQLIAGLYCKNNDFAKSNVYFELSIAKETKNVESEVSALHGLGHNYGRMGDYGKAKTYLEQVLAIESERGDDRIVKTYRAMGDVLVAQEGREKEAISMFHKCAGLFEEGNASAELILVLIKLGQSYTNIGAWDDAVIALEKSLSIAEFIEDERLAEFIEDERLGNQLKAEAKEVLGKVYLAKDEALPERNDELIRKALFWSQAAFNHLQISNGGVSLELNLDLMQEYYFLGDSENAHVALKGYLEGAVRLGESHCQTCYQTCAEDAIMAKCSVCKVARYCSRGHSIQAWAKGRLCHKVMCPFLKRWRKIKQGEDTTTELCDKLVNDFFDRALAS